MAKKKTISLEGAVMTEAGLSYKGVIMDPIVEKCEGCDRVVSCENANYCTTYAKPELKWAKGACNFATHIQANVDKAGKVKVNPLKASKRAARGR
jgi:hypothetical protein